MKTTDNRMANPANRNPDTPQRRKPRDPPVILPVERVLVQPPPEAVCKCPHCGAARINGWDTLGSWPGSTDIRKRCRACGIKILVSNDYRSQRIIG
jgi:hypothetical protein